MTQVSVTMTTAGTCWWESLLFMILIGPIVLFVPCRRVKGQTQDGNKLWDATQTKSERFEVLEVSVIQSQRETA